MTYVLDVVVKAYLLEECGEYATQKDGVAVTKPAC
jgi:hypothetical protein